MTTSGATAIGGADRYLYGIVADDGTPLPAVDGIGGSPLRLVPLRGTGRGPGLAAVVSDAGALSDRVRRADLLAHSGVMQALAADRDVLPMRFGTLWPAEDDESGDLLASRLGPLHRLMDRLAGRVEMQVRVSYDEVAVTAAVVSGERRVRRARDRARGRGQDPSAQIELGRQFSAALEDRRARDRRDLSRRLGRAAEAMAVEDGRGDFGVLKAACLVERRRLDRFDRTLTDLAREGEGLLVFDVMGPLPPYSFVGQPLGERA